MIGDRGIDTYRYGDVRRLSPEAPVPVFEPSYEIVLEGMAANVAKNLETLGCEVHFRHTQDCHKERLIDRRSKQHLIRIDQDSTCHPLSSFSLEKELTYKDAVVISDYNKGTVTYELIEWLRKTYSGPIFVDTKKTDLARLNGCWIKINNLEKEQAKTLPDPQWLIVTQGDRGALYRDRLIPAVSVGDVTDVCGAGDTFLAALTFEYLRSNSIEKAVTFANRASSVTVQHVGVYAPTVEEIENAA